MAHTILALVLSLILTFSLSSPVAAAPADVNQTSGGLSLSPTIGGLYYKGTDTRSLNPMVGIKIGYDITGKAIDDSLGVEGTLNYFRASSDNGGSGTNGYIGRIDALYSLMLSKKIVPYLAAGAGAIVISGDATSKAIPLFNYGFGMKYFLKDYLALRADARHLLTFKNAASRNNFELSVGLSYYFGKESAKKIVPLPKEKPPVKEPQEKAQEPITTKVPLPVPELESEAPEAPPETAPAREQDNGPAPAELPEKPAPHPSTPSSGIDCYYTLAARGVVNRKELEPLLKKLKTAGRQAAVRKETRATEGYRLTSESYKEKQSALKHQDELDRRYRNSFIVREGESWCIIVGSYITEDIALQEQQRLAGKNVPVRVVRAKISLPVWRITSGRYPDQQQAEDAVKILAELGIETSVVKVCPGTADHEGQILVNELTIEFGVDQYDVMPHYSGQIEEIARTLKSSPASTAIIEGHTDNTGMRSHNLKLSQRRAQSVKNSLVNFGIDPKRIVIKAFGSSRPIADNETTTGRQRNRRAVEVVIVSH